MDLTERTIDSREVFRGRIIRVRQDTVRLPNGKESSREVVEHPGGVGILAIDGEDRVVLVRQYRYAFERVLTEIPAGKREIRKLHALQKQDGYALIPLSVYFKNSRVKVELGLCKGKKTYDKRDAVAKRDAKREMDRAMREKNRG